MVRTVTVRAQVVIPILDGGTCGTFYSFTGFDQAHEHFAIGLGSPDPACPVVRLHSECITGDVFGSQRCDCGQQLTEALGRLTADGGYLLYLRQEGRGIGLYAKLDAYLLQEQGLDTFEANRQLRHPEDARSFECAAEMLRAMGVRRCRLITNNPNKAADLLAGGIEVAEVLPTGVYLTRHNRRYLEAKAQKKNHAIDLQRHDLAKANVA